MDKHGNALAEALDRVHGCVELGLRVLWPAEEPAVAPGRNVTASSIPYVFIRDEPGRQYMLRRLADETRRQQRQIRAQRFADAIRRALASLVRQQTEHLLLTPRMQLTAAYLVDRNGVAAVRERIEALGTEYPGLRLLCTGPWPPYHFAPALTEREQHNVQDFAARYCR